MNSQSEPLSSQARIAELQAITRDYSRYAASAGGFSAVIGGFLGLLSYGIGASLAATIPTRVMLIALPMIWLLSRELLVRHYYQRLGRVEEIPDPARVRTQAWLLGGIAVIVGLIVLGSFAGMNPDPPAAAFDTALYLLIVAAIPVIAWRCLHTPLDLVIGVFLLCQAALAASGSSFSRWGSALVFVPASILMIAVGLRQQSSFRRLQQRMRDFLLSARSQA